jgi:hypothetical protein
MDTILERPAVMIDTDTDIFVTEDAHKLYIREKLTEAEAYAARPDAKWYTSEEVWARIEEKFSDVL